MLDREEEYRKMAQVESIHWWYLTLHRLVLKNLELHFSNKECSILDAGSGTGGLMLFLGINGYKNLHGFDLSDDAVRICRDKNLKVSQADLRELDKVFPNQTFDVIVSNDTLYFLDQKEIVQFLKVSYQRLNRGGILICNLPALEAFGGIHDLAVGIKRRFTITDISVLLQIVNFELIQQLYWPLLLSPVIFFVRFLQRVKMLLNPDSIIQSDLDVPAPKINRFLEKLCNWDIDHLRYRPFGSSLLIVLGKK